MKIHENDVIIRWMGAFRGKRIPLNEAFPYEWSCEERTIAAAELLRPTKGRYLSRIAPFKANVGLVIDKGHVYRRFNYDCWSEPNKTGTELHMGRKSRNAAPKGHKFWHTECWVNMPGAILGVAVFGSWAAISKKDRAMIVNFTNEHDLNVYCLTYKGQFEKVKV